MTLYVLIGIAVWLACGVAAAGLNYAYFQREFPSLAVEGESKDFWSSLTLGLLFGPVGLLTCLTDGTHGWTLIRTNKRR